MYCGNLISLISWFHFQLSEHLFHCYHGYNVLYDSLEDFDCCYHGLQFVAVEYHYLVWKWSWMHRCEEVMLNWFWPTYLEFVLWVRVVNFLQSH